MTKLTWRDSTPAYCSRLDGIAVRRGSRCWQRQCLGRRSCRSWVDIRLVVLRDMPCRSRRVGMAPEERGPMLRLRGWREVLLLGAKAFEVSLAPSLSLSPRWNLFFFFVRLDSGIFHRPKRLGRFLMSWRLSGIEALTVFFGGELAM